MPTTPDPRKPGCTLAVYVNEEGRKRRRSFPSEAKAELHLLLHAGKGIAGDLSRVHFPALVLYFEQTMLKRYGHHGQNHARLRKKVLSNVRMLERFVVPVLGDKLVRDISTADLADVRYGFRLADHSPATIKSYMKTVAFVLKLAELRGCISSNPSKDVGKATAKRSGAPSKGRNTGPRPRKGVSPVPDTALSAMRLHARPREQFGVDLMSMAGASLAEANAVDDTNIDLHKRMVTFSHVMDESRRVPQLDPVSVRSIKMPDALMSSLLRMLAMRRLDGRTGPILSPRMYSNTLGLLQIRAGVSRAVRKGAGNVPVYPADQMRDTAAIRWIEAGVKAREIQDRLGERTIRLVRLRYKKYFQANRHGQIVGKVDAAIDRLFRST